MGAKKNIRILIIDDDREDAMILQRYLNQCQRYAVESKYAEDIHQARQMLAETSLDLIFLDNRLSGGMTAEKILRAFLENGIDIPIVIYTGTSDQQTAVELMKIGAYDYIVKDNATVEMLEKTINNILERHTLKNKQKQAEQAIKQQKGLLENIISNIPHYVFWKDRSSIYLGCNENFAKVAGVNSPDDIVGKTDYELAWRRQEADSFIKHDKEILESGNPLLNIEETQLQADGKQATLLYSIVPLKDSADNVIGLLGIYADITQRKQAEQRLESLNKQLADTVEKLTRSNRELGDFAHIVAHDLKSPLRAIGTLADLMNRDYADRLDEKGRERIRLLVERAKRMNRFIDAVLKYSEIGFDGRDSEQVDLNELVTEISETIEPHQDIDVAVVDRLPVIICEKVRMQQVFQNLLSNAVKYMDKPKGEVKVGCVEEDGFWKFSVSDDGPGIEAKYLDKIFKMFQTLEPRDEIDSTGAGLAVVKKIVESYNGKIWVESQPGQGSTFFFTLPRVECEVASEKQCADIACRR